MQSVTASRPYLLLAASFLLAAGISGSALFVSSGPGDLLGPVGGAEELIQIIQGQHTILWTSNAGPVDLVEVTGWPSSDGVHELGGAVMLEVAESDAGVVAFGERPMRLEFSLDG